jgi:hypothetical protein
VGQFLLARGRRHGDGRPFRRGLFSRVGLVAGPALAPVGLTPEALRQQVALLLRPPPA